MFVRTCHILKGKRLIRSALALLAPLLLTHCASVSSTPLAALTGEVRTPENSLPHDEYPFDDSGNYREDWITAQGKRHAN